MDAQQKERITGYFIEEANEHLVTIGDGLQDFAKTVNDPEAIQELYRAAHSIKGGAAMLGLGSLQKNALALEDYFKSLKSAPVAVDETLTGFFLQLFDPLKRLVKELETNLTLPPEREAEILSEINPVAEKLKQYLYQLREGGVSPADNAKEIPSLPDDFTAQVTRSLREMEIQFQQGDHPQQRSALTAQCQELATLGQSFSTWIELLETAKTAIANPNSDYSQLANVLISEIQQAQKHLLASQSDRIRASEQLKRLASAKATAKSVQNQSQIYSAPPAHSKEKEPIMGMEALNTLADLFENDGDLEYTWQEDETGDAVGQNQSSDNENWLAELADDTDFSDLLDEREESDSSASNGVSDEFANLFGELEEEDNRNQDNDLSETEESLSSENEDLSELFGEDFSFEEEEKNGRSVNVNENPKATKFDHFAEDLNALFSDDDVNTGDFFDQWQENQTSAKPQRKLTTPPSPSPQSSEGDVDDFLAISDSSKDESEEAFNLDNSEDEKAEIEWSLESLMDEADAETRQDDSTANRQENASINGRKSVSDSLEDLFSDSPASPEEDLESLFSDPPAESKSNGKAVSPQPESREDDLIDLFAEVSNEATTNELPETEDTEEKFAPANVEALENLFAAESPDTPPEADPFAEWNVEPEPPKARPKTVPVAPAKAKTSTTPAITVDYFEQVDELAALIEQPPTTSESELDVEALAALINTPPQDLEQASIPAEMAVESRSNASQDSNDLDDDFGDLEDLLQQANQSIGQASAKTTSPPARTRSPKAFDQTMRVPVKQLDNLSNLVGELVVNRNSLEQDQERLRQFLDNLLHQVQNLSDVGARMQDLYERSLLESSLLASRKNYRAAIAAAKSTVPGPMHSHDYDPLEMDRFTGFHLLSQEMIELIVRVREASSDIEFLVDETDQVARNLRQVTTQLQEGLTKTRMMPFAQTADRLPRAVRNIAIEYNKKAELIVEGKDTLIDKMILEHLYDPMTHLVNNAMTHGIELPEERRGKGKPETGKIHIRAFHQGNQTVISVADDGAGIDPEKVKRKAIEKGLITRGEAAGMTNVEVYDLLFHPGFSTKDQADNFAGRGVGMDVVRTSLSEIRGTVSVDSKLGKGTTFTIRLPLTLSICKALCCISNKARIAFPMDGIEDMIDIPPESIQTNAEGEPCVMWRNTLLPFQPLSDLLSYNRQIGRGIVYGGVREDDMVSLVILRSVNNFIGIQVDQVIGEQEIVIKQLEGPIPKPTGIAGATVLGDGRIMPIGDVLELIDLAQGRIRKDSSSMLWQQAPIPSKPESDSVKTEPMVLIVDDSITVRELLSLSFNKAGYRVEQARDGMEAWDKLRSGLPCDLIFCDIEMPRMDGLELLSRLQQDEELRGIPMAMLTSRGAQRHRQMASDMGAKAYFTKPYLEEALLDAAQRMLQGDDLLNQTRRPETPATAPPSVLIIDDSVTVRELLSMTFQKAGYQVEQARDGQDAWEKLNSEKHFDLVFCDIEMPRMDGLELLSHLNQDEKLNKVPVAMLTSRGAQKHRKIAADRGAKGYFTKPYVEDVLIDAAKRMRDGEVLLESES